MRTILIALLLVSPAFAQMSPAEAMRQMKAAEASKEAQPELTPDQQTIAQLRAENAMLKRKVASYESRLRSLTAKLNALLRRTAKSPESPVPLAPKLCPKSETLFDLFKDCPTDPKLLAKWIEKHRGKVVCFSSGCQYVMASELHKGYHHVKWFRYAEVERKSFKLFGTCEISGASLNELDIDDVGMVWVFGRLEDVKLVHERGTVMFQPILKNANVISR